MQNPVYNSVDPKPVVNSNHQNSHNTALDNPEYLNTSLSPFANTVFDSSPYWDQTANHQINLENPDYQQDYLPKEIKPNGISKIPAAENPEYLRLAASKSEYIEASAWPLRETVSSTASNAGDDVAAVKRNCGPIKEQSPTPGWTLNPNMCADFPQLAYDYSYLHLSGSCDLGWRVNSQSKKSLLHSFLSLQVIWDWSLMMNANRGGQHLL